jgi:hypothetical protein
MTTTTEVKPLMRPAIQLAPGDVIASPFLPHGRTAEVLHVLPYPLLGWQWVMVIHQTGDWAPIADSFLATADIPLASVAGDDGFGYSREADDDPTPVSPARVPLHTGSVVDGDVLITDKPASDGCE